MSKNNKFNKKLWTLGNKIEDEIKPHLEEFLGKELFRSDDIYDIMDFKSEDNKLVVEIKGRRVKSTQYDTTIITCGKIIEAEKLIKNLTYSGIEWRPKSSVGLDIKEKKEIEEMLELLDNEDDVQKVFHNCKFV